MRADRVGGTRCQTVEASGMDDAVPAGAYQYALSGRLLAARREGFSLRAGRRVSRRGRVAAGCAGISTAGKAAEAVHAEFQRAGFFLTHILECPLEDDASLQTALKTRLAAVATRVRRSLKPRRVMAVTAELALVLDEILAMDLGCPVLLDNGKPFRLEGRAGENGAARLREALAGTPAD